MNFQRSLKILVFLIVSHGTVQAQDQYLAHKVQRGETLSSIARRHGVSANALIQHNGISNPDNLRIGQNLSIPGKAAQKSRAQTSQAQRRSGATMANRSSGTGSHKLKSGETLSKIARIHGVSVENLQAWNGITDPTKLKVGQEIRIGSGSGGGAKQPSGQKQNFPPTKSARLESGANGVRSHVMKRGETLSSVSRQYGTTIASLMEINGITDPTRLSVGQKLMLVPSSEVTIARQETMVAQNVYGTSVAGQEPQISTPVQAYKSLVSGNRSHSFRQHTVRPGDTLHSISQENNISVQALRSANGLGESNFIRDGQQLKIPDERSMDHVLAAHDSAATKRSVETAESPGAGQIKPLFEVPPVEKPSRPVTPTRQHSNHFGFAPTPTAPANSEYLYYTVGPSVTQPSIADQPEQAEDIDAVARSFATTAEEIRKLNNLAPGEPLKIGSIITVPAAGMFGNSSTNGLAGH